MAEAFQAVAYPRELVRTVALKDGTSARLRPIRPDDEPRLVDLYERLSRHTAYQRFFTKRLGELPGVASLRSLIAMKTVKATTALPV